MQPFAQRFAQASHQTARYLNSESSRVQHTIEANMVTTCHHSQCEEETQTEGPLHWVNTCTQTDLLQSYRAAHILDGEELQNAKVLQRPDGDVMSASVPHLIGLFQQAWDVKTRKNSLDRSVI